MANENVIKRFDSTVVVYRCNKSGYVNINYLLEAITATHIQPCFNYWNA